MLARADQLSVTDRTRVCLHPLSMRADGSGWVIGRVETGDFIAVPREGQRAVDLLDGGLTVGAVRARLRAESDQELDIVDFVESLLELGFVARCDGRPVEQCRAPAATFGWLQQGHVAWTLHPLTAVVVGAIVVTGIALLIRQPALLPSGHDLVWNDRGSLTILGDATLGWMMVLLHELGHLCTARAAGVPARITLGTRLQFLVAQTDVTGIWAAARRTRLTVYLSGVAVNLMIGTAAVGVRTLAQPHSAVDHLAAAACAISLLSILTQFLVFMRTDLYFLLQDLTGAHNLYADSIGHLRYLAVRAWLSVTQSRRSYAGEALSTRGRRVVAVYSPVLLFGTAACLAGAAVITVPATITIQSQAMHTLLAAPSGPSSTGRLIDSTTTLLVTGSAGVLWACAWWRGHAHQARAVANTLIHLSRRG